MTQQEIYREAAALPFDEQKELVEKLSRNLQRETSENGNKEAEERELSIEERKAIVDSLRGIAAVEGKTPPTDEEIREDYTNYLMEKYK
ncbi:hypothetical protein BH20ACI1_BH20ACI1_28820 [soil metagenome]